MIKLTDYARSGGCAAKWAPADLAEILSDVPMLRVPELLVGCETGDDAAVYRLNEQQAIIVTTDFITPVCEDPFLFGQIAASNAMSDIYAMGGTVLLALNIAAFPSKELPKKILGDIMRGGASKMNEVGAVLAGGHTVKDQELKYGLAVVGLIHPQQVLTNAKARVEDRLILTKPLGSGVLVAHLKEYQAEEIHDYLTDVYVSMTQLNAAAVPIMHAHEVSACTDVTGFGLAVHAGKMADAAKVTFRIHPQRLPIFQATAAAFKKFGLSSAGNCNRQAMEGKIQIEQSLDEVALALCFDPQTSGGLLMSVPSRQVASCIKSLHAAGYLHAVEIGEVLPRRSSTIEFTAE